MLRRNTTILSLFALTVWGCDGGGDTPIEGRVGPLGGTLRQGDVVLSVPAGALTSDVTLSVRCEAASPDGYVAISPVCRFEPAGTHFALPVSVRFPVTGATSMASVWWSREGAEGYEPRATTFSGSSATALVTHFSTGFVGERGGAMRDAASDIAADATPDTMRDGGSDGTLDAAIDSTVDVTVDGAMDGATDAAVDTAVDVVEDVVFGSAAAPRPIMPRTGSRSISNRPRVRWALPTGVTSARLTFCRDHAMTVGCVSTVVSGEQGQPSAPLASGVWFWSLRGVAGGLPGADRSTVWRLTVPTTTGAAQGFSGGEYDANGDGVADVVAPQPAGGIRVSVYLGGAGGPSASRVVNVPQPITGRADVAVFEDGDFDGDGYTDLAFLSERTSSASMLDVLVMRGSASGPVGPIVTAARTVAPPETILHAGDVNGDGRDDLLAGNAVLLGGPTGLSTAGALLPLARGRFAGDVDGDGFNDIVGPGDRGEVLIRGSAGADFSSVTPLGATVVPTGDLNNDGYADLLVGGVVRVGSPTGPTAETAASPRVPDVRADWLFGEIADLDGDGDDDLFVNRMPSRVYVLRGDPRAQFTVEGRTTTTQRVVFNAGDVDGDGVVDQRSSDGVRLGAFDPDVLGSRFTMLGAVTGAAVPAIVNVGDMNGDGRDDLAVGPEAGETSMRWFASTSTGFAAPVALVTAAHAGVAHVVAAGDLDRDGLADLVVSNGPSAARVIFGARTGLGGRTRDLAGVPATSGVAVPVAPGDLNGDGNVDLVMASADVSPRLVIYLGTPTGPASMGTSESNASTDPRVMYRYNVVGPGGDVNGDGFRDLLLFTTTNGPITTNYGLGAWFGSATGLSSGTGSGVGLAIPRYPYSPADAPVTLGDIDGDGRSEVSCLLAIEGLEDRPHFTLPGASAILPAGDYDGDGIAEILTHEPPFLAVRAGVRGGGTFDRILRRWVANVSGPSRMYPPLLTFVSDRDGDRHPELVAADDRVTLYYSSSPPDTGWRALPSL